MPIIIHQKDPAGIARLDVYHAPDNTNVLEWLQDTFETSDHMCGDLACSFILNKREIYRTDDDKYQEHELRFAISGNDELMIVNRPAGITPVEWVVIVISIALAATTYILANQTMPELPGAEAAQSESPNNRLNAARNQFRPGLAIPECFGFGVSYPDFIQPSYYFYDKNIKKQIELFCISVSEVAVPEVRVGETNITEIPESTADIYLPGQVPPAEFLKIHQPASTIDGQTLLAPNDGNIIKNNVSFELSGGNPFTIVKVADKEIIYDLSLSVGGFLYVRASGDLSIFPTSGTASVGQICPAGTQALRNGSVWHRTSQVVSGDITSLNFTALTAIVGGVSVTLGAAESSTPAFNGVFGIQAIDLGATPAEIMIETVTGDPGSYTGSLGRGYSQGVLGNGTGGELDTWVGWFDLPGNDIEEAWIHWQAPQGVRNVNGDGNAISTTISLEFQIESIINDTPTGNVWTQTESITDNTLDAQFRTTRFEPANFPGMTRSGYRCRVKRTTNVISSQGRASESVKLERYVSVTPYDNPEFGDVTTMLVQRKATLFSADQASQKINCDFRRKLPYYNRDTGVYDVNDLRETDSFADAVAYTLLKAGSEPLERVDLDSLYSTYDNLSDSQLGGFTFTFDDANLSKGERVESICNVARVASFGNNAIWQFSRDEIKQLRGALFNRRSLRGNEGKQTWMPQRTDDADSVRVSYVDPDENTEKFIERKFDLNTGDIVIGEVGIVPKEIKLAGCRNLYQATNRAELEIRRIAYQRQTVKDTTYREALEINLLDRVGWVDINDGDVFDGELLGFNGSTFDTTERFIPVDGETYFVYLTNNEGYPSNTVQCFPRSDTEFGFTANGINGAYLPNDDEQIGSRYVIATADELAATDFTLRSRTPSSDGTVEIELVQYDARMYEMDGVTTPGAPPIIPSGLISFKVTDNPNDSTANVTFENDGSIVIESGNTLWYSGGEIPNIGANFEVKAALVSGTAPTGTLDTWQAIDVNRSWSLTQSGASGESDCVLEFSVRQIGFEDNTATNNISISAIQAAPVALPAVINASVSNELGFASCDLSVDSNGTWKATDNQSGTYTTVAEFIGSGFEARATGVAGGDLVGTVDDWIGLGGGGTEWRVETSSATTVTFNLEIRSVNDNLITDTVAVSLSASVV